MNSYKMENIRHVAVMGHGKCGKSSIIEAMLFNSGAINRIGKNADGTLASDFDIEETKRQMSISTSVAPIEWKDNKLNMLDTPGYFDFVGEVIEGMDVVIKIEKRAVDAKLRPLEPAIIKRVREIEKP